jgi:hypothetical protein
VLAAESIVQDSDGPLQLRCTSPGPFRCTKVTADHDPGIAGTWFQTSEVSTPTRQKNSWQVNISRIQPHLLADAAPTRTASYITRATWAGGRSTGDAFPLSHMLPFWANPWSFTAGLFHQGIVGCLVKRSASQRRSLGIPSQHSGKQKPDCSCNPNEQLAHS